MDRYVGDPVARFENESLSSTEVSVMVAVAASESNAFFSIEGPRIPKPGRWAEDRFQLDTGAQRSVISGGLALEIGLQLWGDTVQLETVRGIVRAKESWIRVCIGADWLLMPCWVPWPIERSRNSEENLLGLAGILDRYDLVLRKEEVLVCRRREWPELSGRNGE
jgi:hypothetical protein